MPRFHTELSGNVLYIHGEDHALGRFVQISDKRFAGTSKDVQGEGYVLDWCDIFGFDVNLINAKTEDLMDHKKLLAMCDQFAKTIE